MTVRQARELRPVPLGIAGTVVIVLVVLAALNLRSLPLVHQRDTYHAVVTETAGLSEGDTVQLSGVEVGRVTGLGIDGARVVIDFTVGDDIALGDETTAHIATQTVLGTKTLRLDSAGDGRLDTGGTIGLDRTDAPYHLVDVLGKLTTTTEDIDTDSAADAADELAAVLRRTPDDLRGALTGVDRLSQTVAERDRSLRELLDHAENTTSVLAEQSDKVATLIDDGTTVLRELVRRRAAVSRLAARIDDVGTRITSVIDDNDEQLRPALERLNTVVARLNDNSDDLSAAIAKLGPYVTELGEAVASGPYFNSYIQNLIPGQIIAPLIDQALSGGGQDGEGPR